MSYEVRFPKAVEDKIKSYNLNPRWTLALATEITSFLERTPRSHLGKRIAAPVRCVICRMDFYGPFDMPASVTLWVNDTEADGVRVIYDIDLRMRSQSDYQPCD